MKRVSLTPAVFHLSREVARAGQMYADNPIVPRGPDLAPLMKRLKIKIASVLELEATHEPVFLCASGSGGIAASLASCVPGSQIAVLVNGAYGERQASFAGRLGMDVLAYRLPFGERPDIDHFERLIVSRNTAAVALVHGETSTCSLNPISEIASMARKNGALVIVDAISTAFVDPLPGKDVDVFVCSTNKALESHPDLALVLVRRDLLQRLDRAPFRIPYLDLAEAWQSQLRGEHPYTINIRSLLEAEAAVDVLVQEGGVPGRRSKYERRSSLLRSGFEELGLKLFRKPGMPLQCIGTALFLPPRVSYHELSANLASPQMGGECYEIYSAQGELSDSVFRIFNMGCYEIAVYQRFLDALRRVLSRTGKRLR